MIKMSLTLSIRDNELALKWWAVVFCCGFWDGIQRAVFSPVGFTFFCSLDNIWFSYLLGFSR